MIINEKRRAEQSIEGMIRNKKEERIEERKIHETTEEETESEG